MSRQVQLRDWRRACDALDEFTRRVLAASVREGSIGSA
jgi:menaquinone-dependent protoporphyrinogen IX oxidase